MKMANHKNALPVSQDGVGVIKKHQPKKYLRIFRLNISILKTKILKFTSTFPRC